MRLSLRSKVTLEFSFLRPPESHRGKVLYQEWRTEVLSFQKLVIGFSPRDSVWNGHEVIRKSLNWLGGLNNARSFSRSSGAWRPGECSLPGLQLACTFPESPHHLFPVRREGERPLVSAWSYRVREPTFMTSYENPELLLWRPYLQMQSHCRTGRQHMNMGWGWHNSVNKITLVEGKPAGKYSWMPHLF